MIESEASMSTPVSSNMLIFKAELFCGGKVTFCISSQHPTWVKRMKQMHRGRSLLCGWVHKDWPSCCSADTACEGERMYHSWGLIPLAAEGKLPQLIWKSSRLNKCKQIMWAHLEHLALMWVQTKTGNKILSWLKTKQWQEKTLLWILALIVKW